MEFRKVKLGTLDYAAGQKKTLELSRDGILLQLNLRVRFTVTAGASAMVGALFQTIARGIRRADVVIDGRDTVLSHSGEMLAARAIYEHGVVIDGMEDTFVLTGSATVTSYDVTIPIPFYLPRSADPFAAALPINRYRQATLELTFANGAADLVTTVNSAALSAFTVDVEAEYAFVTPADGWWSKPFLVRELSVVEKDFTAAATAMVLPIFTGAGGVSAIRSVALATLEGLVGTDADLNSLEVVAGTFVWQKIDAAAIQASNKATFATAILTGFYMLPFVKGGQEAMAINAGGLTADLNAVLNVNSATAGKVLMSIERLRPPANL